MTFDECLENMLEDIRVELADEFDRNFERGSFFGEEKWPKSTRPGAKTPLIDSGPCAAPSGEPSGGTPSSSPVR